MLNKNINIRNINKMLVKNNNKMFGGSTKRPPASPPSPSSSSSIATTPPLRSLSSSFFARTEQKSKHESSSREFLPPLPTPTSTPPPALAPIPAPALAVTPTRNKYPLTSSAALPFVAVSTTASKLLPVSLPHTQLASLQTMAKPTDGAATIPVVKASAGAAASNALVGRAKLLQQQCSRHRQIQQQQQYHHPHHHHHHTPQLRFRLLPGLKATSFFTILTLVCLETVLLSTVSNCAKTFYMHWNTSNSIFRIDNTDHIIDVNKGNLAFEFDQVHIICPVYEPGTFENETEKYIIYNVSKVEYETCRITNADPRVIAICDKPQKLMFFTITFRPFTPQPGGLEFLPGNDYYFISTSSKDDLYRRIGGRCSTNNMKVVFKVCCASEDKNNRTNNNIGGSGGGIGNGGINSGNSGSSNSNTAIQQQHNNNININGGGGGGGGQLPSPKLPGMGGGMNNGGNNGLNNGGGGLMINGNSGTSINTNIDQFNRIPMQQPNNINGNSGMGMGMGNGNMGMNGIGLNGGVNGQHPTGIRVNNVPSSQQHPSQKNGMHGGFIAPMANINTNSSNVVQSTISWPDWGNHNNHNGDHSGGNGNSGSGGGNGGNGGGGNPPDQNGTPVSTIGIHPHFYPPHITSPRPNINSAVNNSSNNSPSHKPTKKTNDYDKHPNEVVKNEELTYNSAAPSLYKVTRRRRGGVAGWISSDSKLTPRKSLRFNKSTPYKGIYQKFKSLLQLLLFTSNHRNRMNTINTFINFIYNCNPIIITTTVLVTLSNLFQYKLSSWSMRCYYSYSSKVQPPTSESTLTLTTKTTTTTTTTKTSTSKLRLKLSSSSSSSLLYEIPLLPPVDSIREARLSKLLNVASSER